MWEAGSVQCEGHTGCSTEGPCCRIPSVSPRGQSPLPQGFPDTSRWGQSPPLWPELPESVMARWAWLGGSRGDTRVPPLTVRAENRVAVGMPRRRVRVCTCVWAGSCQRPPHTRERGHPRKPGPRASLARAEAGAPALRVGGPRDQDSDRQPAAPCQAGRGLDVRRVLRVLVRCWGLGHTLHVTLYTHATYAHITHTTHRHHTRHTHNIHCT